MTSPTLELKLHENNSDHFPKFLELNRQWIEQYFQMEPCDWDLEREIENRAKNGDYFFTVSAHDISITGPTSGEESSEEKVVGACALFLSKNHSVIQFEVARMAVDPQFHGKGIAKFLLSHLLKRAEDFNAKRLFLMTNTVLEAAVSLYRKWGFTDCMVGPHPDYGRCNLVMEKIL